MRVIREEVEKLMEAERYGFLELVKIIEVLRAPDGCPWDREQTHASLKRNLIEEAYEVLEAIDKENDGMIREELGDVLLQVVFHANIAETFGIDDVIDGVCRKLISRHPHIFGAVTADTAEAVLANWEQIKRAEKGHRSHTPVLKGVPANLPALMRAFKVQQKARDAGRVFDFRDANHAMEKVFEELDELRGAIDAGTNAQRGAIDAGAYELRSKRENEADMLRAIREDGADGDKKAPEKEEELGDLLFSVVNLARLSGIHPELALTAATEKFIRRFEAMEELVSADNLKLEDITQQEADAYWERVKRV